MLKVYSWELFLQASVNYSILKHTNIVINNTKYVKNLNFLPSENVFSKKTVTQEDELSVINFRVIILNRARCIKLNPWFSICFSIEKYIWTALQSNIFEQLNRVIHSNSFFWAKHLNKIGYTTLEQLFGVNHFFWVTLLNWDKRPTLIRKTNVAKELLKCLYIRLVTCK